MISFKEAQQVIASHANSFGEEEINLDQASGRILCGMIEADRDYPPFNRASMDGFAIKKDNWDNGIRDFKIIETIYAGGENKKKINDGECYKIMTGAAVPQGADVVIRREDTVENNNHVSIAVSVVNLHQNIAAQGKDIKAATTVINNPARCSPAIIGVLASLGKNKILVKKLPRVSIITTGDEVVDITEKITPVQIRNTNRYVLNSLLNQWNIKPVVSLHAPDDIEKLRSVIADCSIKSDIIILCGGVSAGDADYVPMVLEQLGAKKIFHKVAIKPGKPLWFGKFLNGPVIFALPGNPLSCMVTFKLFIEIFLARSFGLELPQVLSLPFKGTRERKSSLDEFFPVKISGDPSMLEPINFNSSGDITAMIEADGIAQHPIEIANLVSGACINFYRFS